MLTRISITIPEDLVAQADERARAIDRSRSWLIVDALRKYLAESPREPAPGSAGRQSTHPAPLGAGLGPYRQQQLEADLRLTPEQRVREAEKTARVSERRTPRSRRDRLITFHRFEDYLEWERWEDRLR